MICEMFPKQCVGGYCVGYTTYLRLVAKNPWYNYYLQANYTRTYIINVVSLTAVKQFLPKLIQRHNRGLTGERLLHHTGGCILACLVVNL